MNIPEVLESLYRMESAIADIYGCFISEFEGDSRLETFWEEMYTGRKNLLHLVERCKTVIPRDSRDSLPGKDIPYEDLLEQVGRCEMEIKEQKTEMNRALQIAFQLETLSIQSVFNEMIRLPREPFFHILSEIHLKVRQNMGRLIRGIETFCTATELLYRVKEIKEKVIERRSGEDRRTGQMEFSGMDRRKEDRRKGTLVKILWH